VRIGAVEGKYRCGKGEGTKGTEAWEGKQKIYVPLKAYFPGE